MIPMAGKKRVAVLDAGAGILTPVESLFEEISTDRLELVTYNSSQLAMAELDKDSPCVAVVGIAEGAEEILQYLSALVKRGIPFILIGPPSGGASLEMAKSYYKPLAYLEKPLDKLSLLVHIADAADLTKREPLWALGPDILQQLCSSDYGLVLLDRDFNIIWLSQSLEAKGFLLQAVRGQKAYKVFDNIDTPYDNSPTLKAITGGKMNNLVKKGADASLYKVTAVPLVGKTGKIEFVAEFSEKLWDNNKGSKQ